MKKALLMLNPKSGRMGAKQQMFNIITLLSEKYDVLVHVTKSTEDVYETAKKCEFGTLIVCGGDGTLSHTVDGLMENPNRDRIKLAYLPCGTANDVAASLGIPKRVTEAVKYICANEPQPHDVGKFGDRHFIYTASFGTFAKTSYETPQDVKNVLGGFAYLLNGAPEIMNIKERRMTITCDKGILNENDIAFCAITNSFFLGGGVIKYPKNLVKLADGKFEMLLIRKPKNLTDVEQLLRAFMFGEFDGPLVTVLQSSHFSVRTYEETLWTIDGDSGNDVRNVEISCESGMLNLIKK